MIFDVIPAERGGDSLLDDGRLRPASTVAWDRVSAPETSGPRNRALVRRVFESARSILNTRFSVRHCSPFGRCGQKGAHSLLCVPLVAADKLLASFIWTPASCDALQPG